MLLRVGAVEPRQRLHRLDASQCLVHVHRVQQRLIVTSLEFVGANQKAIRIFLDSIGDISAGEAVQ